MSTIGWVDFSSTDRERVAQILAMLREPGTLDELGIGQIRDAFADSLFPGFSTIQTRAKYFITVPRIFRAYHKLSKRERRQQSLEIYLQNQENTLAESLVKKHSSQDSKTIGIIGATKIGQGGVARRPSSVYWNGLRQFGIIDSNVSLTEFSRKYGREITHYKVASGDDGCDDSDSFEIKSLVHIAPASNDWLQDIDINLTKKEAIFLRDKIRQSRNIQHSIPTQIFNTQLLNKSLDEKLNSFAALSDWLQSKPAISSTCRSNAKLAQEFSLAMEGAHIRYNCIVAQKVENDIWLQELNEQFGKWYDRVMKVSLFHDDAATTWIASAQKQNLKLKSKSVNFVHSWSKAIKENFSSTDLDYLVENQAYQNKKNRSLLRKQLPSNTKWIGMDTLDYRWNQVRRILSDINKGLTC